MKKQIIQSINDPEVLQMLFRKDKSGFTLDFSEASAGIDMTIGLFSIIGMEIGELYMENIGIVGLVVLPVVAAWLILPGLFLAGFKGKSLDRVEKIICSYLPVYFLYCVVVIFVFPFLFSLTPIHS